VRFKVLAILSESSYFGPENKKGCAMPKVAKEKHKLLHDKPYTKVTSRSQSLFSEFKSEDKNNTTKSDRSPQSYAYFFGLNISVNKLISNIAKSSGRSINILDSGCGQAFVIDQLLSDANLNNCIESITGVSLHYFTNTQKVMAKHGKRFKYYSGKVQDVLAKDSETHNAFDLIFDVWGAYKYSEDKLGLIKQYHQALKPEGRAYVYLGKENVFIKNESGQKVKFAEWAVKTFPETFQVIDSHRLNSKKTLIIAKTTARLLIPEFKIESSEEKPSFGYPYKFDKKSFLTQKEKYKHGNALFFDDVVVKPETSQRMQLRSLAFPKPK